MSATIKLKYLARAVLIIGCAIIATIVIAPAQISSQIIALNIPGQVLTEHLGWDGMPDNAKNELLFLFSQLQLQQYVDALRWTFDGTFYNAYFMQSNYRMGAIVTNTPNVKQWSRDLLWLTQLPQVIQGYITSHSLIVSQAMRIAYNNELLPFGTWWPNNENYAFYTIICGTAVYVFDHNGVLQ